ncbi:hypothetical protein BCR42DRAFT_428090 [Absidia repens]|uniref:Uncharacterized protein n=1 Tax=Absidia repens TaxID=90262 RepID=A0A1X2HYX8_9FUNG|nr:hypothetical protein BCR42DRAFT_428090 [Absidia repens]
MNKVHTPFLSLSFLCHPLSSQFPHPLSSQFPHPLSSQFPHLLKCSALISLNSTNNPLSSIIIYHHRNLLFQHPFPLTFTIKTHCHFI